MRTRHFGALFLLTMAALLSAPAIHGDGARISEPFGPGPGLHEIRWDLDAESEMMAAVTVAEAALGRQGEAIWEWRNATQQWSVFRPGLAFLSTLDALESDHVYWFVLGDVVDVPVPEPEPAPEATQVFSGNGSDVIFFDLARGIAIFDLVHGGRSNFIVQLLAEPGDLLANEIGEWAGSVAVAVDDGSFGLEIDADGFWSVTVRQPGAEPSRPVGVYDCVDRFDLWDLQAIEPEDFVSFVCDRGAVTPPFDFSGGLGIVGLSHSGQSNFIVELIDAESGVVLDLLANEIGIVDSEQTTFNVPAGRYRLAVIADGLWIIVVTP